VGHFTVPSGSSPVLTYGHLPVRGTWWMTLYGVAFQRNGTPSNVIPGDNVGADGFSLAVPTVERGVFPKSCIQLGISNIETRENLEKLAFGVRRLKHEIAPAATLFFRSRKWSF